MGGVKIHVLLLLAVFLSGLTAIIPLGWIGADALESSYREYAVRDMTANANLFALSLPATPENEASPMLASLAEEAAKDSATRFTFIRPDGEVVADSDEDAARMENHVNRPEVREALAGKTGVDIRKSPTLGTEWIYVAIPHNGGTVVRAAASLDDLNGRLWLWWKWVIFGFGVSLVILLAMALLVSRAVSKPIEAAAAAAEHYASGDLSYRLPVAGAAEMRMLSTSMGVMAAELDARFKLVTRQREEMTAVFENMSEGVLAVDDTGQIMLMNGAAQSLLNLPGDVSGHGIEAICRNADLLDAIHETASTGHPFEREIRIRRDDDDEALARLHTARICEDGQNIGVLVILRDVTRIRRLEIMRRDFVANVSHELRTPVTTIQSCLETILDDDTGFGNDNREFVEMALRSTRRMGAIIDNLLFLAGMESGAGKETGKVAIGPISPILDEAVSLCREEARARKTVIAIECEDGLTALVNPQLVVHALVNLLDNSIKYGPEGGAITVAARRNGERVQISVSDQGPGIAPRHQSRVFERFYRVDGAARVKKGSGLGLAIVKHIALAQGGDIRLESEIGSGSRFIMGLPGK